MSSRTEALIEKLSENHPKGFDLSLGRITDLLEKLGNPHQRIPPAIHVAGTNGKGSTIAFARAILEAAGYRVHVHTSPHLVNWQERYRLAGTLVSDDVLADAIERAAEANENQPITIFEIMSAVMFILFSEHEADFSLVEVGLGGRFDATNVIEKPLVSAIAPVALDHQAYLGDTLAKIAFEKAGIIKEQIPVVVGMQEDDARETLEAVAGKKNAPALFASQDFDFYEDVTGFVYQDENGLLDLPMPALSGDHQLANAALAIASLRAAGINVPENAWKEGMRTVTWPGRFERLPEGTITHQFPPDTRIWIDGGHNPHAGAAVATELKRKSAGGDTKTIMVCGMLNTKEPVGYFKPFAEMNIEMIAVPVANSDAGLSPKELCTFASKAGLKSLEASDLFDGIRKASQLADQTKSAQILICGSVYMVGEVLDLNGTPPN